jgi:hypothetical protein
MPKSWLHKCKPFLTTDGSERDGGGKDLVPSSNFLGMAPTTNQGDI